MERITIDVSKEELDFIREALEYKCRNLIAYLDVCETGVNKPFEPSNDLKQLNEEINVWLADQKKDKIVATYTVPKKRGRPRKDANAPYGYKKDGTPKKKPGRSAEK